MTDQSVNRVYLARHGRTALNADGRLRGLSDPPLDEVGCAEAARLGAELAYYQPSVVISSPLRRAVATAEAIGAAAHIEVVVDQRLNDRDYGPWTGKPRAAVEAQFGSVDNAPGVEPKAAVTTRALIVFRELTSEYTGPEVVMVSHDAFNTALLCALDPNPNGVGQHTGCYNQLTLVMPAGQSTSTTAA